MTKVEQFLETYGRKDHPDIDESIVALLMDDHFYYITDDLQGWFIPEDISGLEPLGVVVHEHLKSHRE